MKRFYRDYHQNEGLIRFVVIEDESDLLIVVSECDERHQLESFAKKKVHEIRQRILEHIEERPEFLTCLTPMAYTGNDPLIMKMYAESKVAGVGPMATVAGITSEYVGRSFLEKYGPVDILIENGGDLFISSSKERDIAIYAGDTVFSDKLNLLITPEMTPIGICTSAGTIGHSLSFGNADAVVILSEDTALADAVATATGNRVQSADHIKGAMDFAMNIDGVLGVVVIVGDKIGASGAVKFV